MPRPQALDAFYIHVSGCQTGSNLGAEVRKQCVRLLFTAQLWPTLRGKGLILSLSWPKCHGLSLISTASFPPLLPDLKSPHWSCEVRGNGRLMVSSPISPCLMDHINGGHLEDRPSVQWSSSHCLSMCTLEHTDLGWNATLLHLSYVAFGKSVVSPGLRLHLQNGNHSHICLMGL